MESLALTLLIVFVGIALIGPIASRIKIPLNVAEMVFGIIVGVSLFDLIPKSAIIDFITSFGLGYLMFLAGLDLASQKIDRDILKKAVTIALASVSIPFLAGVFLSFWVDVHAILLGTIFCTTSMGLILPLFKDLQMAEKLSTVLLPSVVIVDIMSLFLLAIALNIADRSALDISVLYSFIIMLVLFLLPLVFGRERLRRKIQSMLSGSHHIDMDVKIAFVLIFLLAAASSWLGFHYIIGTFLAGLTVSRVLPETDIVFQSFRRFGWGFFIPMFFIFIGAKVDLPSLFSNVHNLIVLLIIIAVGILAKVVGVGLAAKLSGFGLKRSTACGLLHSARLSLIVAAADVSIEMGLIDESLFSMFVILAITSAIAAPLLARSILMKGTESSCRRE